MVATRSGAGKPAEDPAPPATSTLKAPPKRATKRKTAAEDTPAPVAVQKTEKPAAKAAPTPASPKKPAKRTTRRAAKAVESEPTPAEELQPEPEIVEESQPEVVELPKRAARGRKAAAPAATKPLKPVKEATVKVTKRAAAAASSITKAPARATRGRKATATISIAPPVADNAAVESPLKKPARKPGRKAKAAVEMTPAQTEEAMQAQLNIEASAELPVDYPNTPAHIKAPVSTRDALNALPGYPKTPAHIQAPVSTRDALNALPAGYPNTPVHIEAAVSNREALDVLPGYPKTPAHILAPVSNRDALDALPGYPQAPAHILAPVSTQDALNALPGYPVTPAHILAPVPTQDALNALPGYPSTPAHILAPLSTQDALDELPAGYPSTPGHIMTIEQGFDELPGYPSTPAPKNGDRFFGQAEIAPKSSSSTVGEEEFESALEHTQSIEMYVGGRDYVAHVSSIAAPKENAAIFKTVNFEPSLPPPSLVASASPTKSALRSPAKNGAKTPKKSVSWGEDHEDLDDESASAGILCGTRFLVDVMSQGKDEGLLYRDRLQTMGAQVVYQWKENTPLTHVLFKEGSKDTLEKVAASNGAVKCVNTGWFLDVEKQKKRLPEDDYLVDLNNAKVGAIVPPRTPRRFRELTKAVKPTPAKTPSKFLGRIESSSGSKALSPGDWKTPDSPDFDQSVHPTVIMSVPAKKSYMPLPFGMNSPTNSDFDKSVCSVENKENIEEYHVASPMSVPAKQQYVNDMLPIKVTTGGLFDNFLSRDRMKALSSAPKSTFMSSGPKKPTVTGEYKKYAQQTPFDEVPQTASSASHSTFLDKPAQKSPFKSQFSPSTFIPTMPLSLWRSPQKSAFGFGQSPQKTSLGFGQSPQKPSFGLGLSPQKSSLMARKPGKFSAIAMPKTPSAQRQADFDMSSTSKKRSAAQSFGGRITSPPKKLRSHGF